MGTIGIFWVYEGKVFGERLAIGDSVCSVQGLLDGAVTHVDWWDSNQDLTSISPNLKHYEYQDIPRGRVLYQTRQQRFLVYLDKQLMNKKSKVAIAGYFGFNTKHADWRSDLHYTTCSEQLARLLDD